MTTASRRPEHGKISTPARNAAGRCNGRAGLAGGSRRAVGRLCKSIFNSRAAGSACAAPQILTKRPCGSATDAKNRNGTPLRFFVGRTPGNVCCRCFLSDLTGLAVLPPSGLAKDLPVKGVNCQWSRWLFIASLPGASSVEALLMIISISLSLSPPRVCSLCSSSTGS